MADLRDLYQEVILDHNRRPRNFRAVPDATRTADGFNPLCGDRFQVSVRLEGDRIADVGFQGAGCAISKAAASLMTDAVKGRTLDEARGLFEAFHRMVTSPDAAIEPAPILARLAVFEGVREFPARVKCATLAWHTLRAALEEETVRPVSTE